MHFALQIFLALSLVTLVTITTRANPSCEFSRRIPNHEAFNQCCPFAMWFGRDLRRDSRCERSRTRWWSSLPDAGTVLPSKQLLGSRKQLVPFNVEEQKLLSESSDTLHSTSSALGPKEIGRRGFPLPAIVFCGRDCRSQIADCRSKICGRGDLAFA
jgi:hypothetical protein